MLLRFLTNGGEGSQNGDKYLYVLVERDRAWPATADAGLQIASSPEGWDADISNEDIAAWEHKTFLKIQEYYDAKTFPQIITRDLRQAQCIFRVKSASVSPAQAFNELIFLLN